MVFFALGVLAKSMVATLPFVLLLLDYWPLGRIREMQNLEFRIENRTSSAKAMEDRPSSAKASSFAGPSEDGTEDRESGGKRAARMAFWGLVREKIPLFALGGGRVRGDGARAGNGAHGTPTGCRSRTASATPWFPMWSICGKWFSRRDWPSPIPSSANGQPPWKVCLAFVCWRQFPRGHRVPEKAPVPARGLALVSGDVVPGHRHRFKYPRIPPMRPLHLSAADRSGPGGDLGGGGLERGLETPAADIRRVDGSGRGALMVIGHRQTSIGKTANRSGLTPFPAPPQTWSPTTTWLHLLQKGRLRDAIPQYQNALEIAPNDEGTRNNLGAALLVNNDLEGAIAQCRKVIEFNPAYENAHCNLGIALAREGNLEEAIGQYREALDFQPDDETALKNLGDALLNRANWTRP